MTEAISFGPQPALHILPYPGPRTSPHRTGLARSPPLTAEQQITKSSSRGAGCGPKRAPRRALLETRSYETNLQTEAFNVLRTERASAGPLERVNQIPTHQHNSTVCLAA